MFCIFKLFIKCILVIKCINWNRYHCKYMYWYILYWNYVQSAILYWLNYVYTYRYEFMKKALLMLHLFIFICTVVYTLRGWVECYSVVNTIFYMYMKFYCDSKINNYLTWLWLVSQQQCVFVTKIICSIRN